MRVFIILFFILTQLSGLAAQTEVQKRHAESQSQTQAVPEAHLQVYLFKGEEKVPEKSVVYIKTDEQLKEHVVYSGFLELSFKTPGLKKVALKKRGPFFALNTASGETSFISLDVKNKNAFLSKYDKFISATKSSADVCLVKGRLLSDESGLPLSEASVFVNGTAEQVKTDLNGEFKIKAPVGGDQSLSFIHKDHRVRVEKISETDCNKSLTVKLYPAMGEMEEVVVLAPNAKGSVSDLLKERKNSKSVSVFIGSDEFKKNGDSNAASALKRVSGLSLVDGRYVFIRGLGERYSSTNLNGANLPSPNPSRRVVPLDMFPTSLIESISIQKSYSVDKPAQFSAGLVEIRTLSIPKKSFFNVSLSTGASSEQALKGEERGTSLAAGGGTSDYLGIDDGSRRLPYEIRQTRENGQAIKFKDPNDWFGDGTGFTADELSTLGASFSDNYDFESQKVNPNFGASVSAGGKLDFGVNKAGVVIKGVYQSSNDFEEQNNKSYIVSSQEEGLRLEDDSSRYETSSQYNLGGQTSFGVEFLKNQKLDFTGLLTRSTISNSEIVENTAIANEEDSFRTYRSFWEERELFTQQVKGSHGIVKNINLDWLWSNSQSKRYRPDEREYRYYLQSGTFVDRSFGNQRIYSDLNDKAEEFKAKVDANFKFNSWLKISTYAGARVFDKDRVSEMQRFTFNRIGQGDTYSLSDSASNILSKENILNEEFRLTDSTLPTDNYKAFEKNNAGFFNLTTTFNFSENTALNLISGLRYEDHIQEVGSFDLLSGELSDDLSQINQAKTFYNYGAVLNLNKKSSLTFAFSETVARPDLQEFAPVVYFNDIENVLEIGNPDLEIAEVQNIDIRYDHYLNSKEFVSLGLFRKNIVNPIESVTVVGTEDAVTFKNIDRAFNDGVEFEFRKHMYKNLFLSGNYSYISSEVEIDQSESGANTSTNRPLQGQSPYLINLSLEYESRFLGLNTALTYNVAGRRIAQVGAFESPDIYEEPFEQLDFTLRKKVSKRQSLGIKVQNILNPLAERTQGGLNTRSFERGTRFSISLSTII